MNKIPYLLRHSSPFDCFGFYFYVFLFFSPQSYFWQFYTEECAKKNISVEDGLSKEDLLDVQKALRVRKLEVLCQIHKALSIHLGPLPTTFTWDPSDPKAHKHIENPFKGATFTPKTFFETVVVNFGLEVGKDAFASYIQRVHPKKKGKKAEQSQDNKKDETEKDIQNEPEKESDSDLETELELETRTHTVDLRREESATNETHKDEKSAKVVKAAKSPVPRCAKHDASRDIWGVPTWLKGRKVSDPTTWISFVNDPRNEYNRAYTVQHLGSVWGSKYRVLYINVDQRTFHTLAHTSVGGCRAATWFGCDAGKYIDRDKGFWDYMVMRFGRTFQTNLGEVNSEGSTAINSFDPSLNLVRNTEFAAKSANGLELGAKLQMVDEMPFVFGKKERLIFGESLMTHAMVFTGVDVDPVTEEVTRYRVENSWGTEKADSGYYSIR